MLGNSGPRITRWAGTTGQAGKLPPGTAVQWRRPVSGGSGYGDR